MDKFRHKLPKDILKKHTKDVNKSLVASDYKHNRVDDPTYISEKTEKKVKKYVKDFLDKAVVKHREHEKHKAEREAQSGSTSVESSSAHKAVAPVETRGAPHGDDDDDVAMSDVEDAPTSSPVKRKREEDVDMMDTSLTPEEVPSVKRVKEETPEEASPPPPPPPPPDTNMGGDDGLNLTPGQAEAFSHAQEEANRLADEAEQDRVRQEEALQRENEEAMREFELEQSHQQSSVSNGTADTNPNHENEQRSKQMILGQ